MEDSFSPRTVAIVALSSLVGGFVAVFGGWMLLHRTPPAAPVVAPIAAPTAPATPSDDVTNAPSPSPPGPTHDGADASADDVSAAVMTDGGAVSIGAVSVSRCWAAGSPAMTPGAACDRLPVIEQHLAARAAQIAGCSSGHGRLSLVLDFRVSTNFARAWGGPSSTIADAGTVAACVRRVTAPLPLTTMPHQFDRYIVNVAFEW